LVEFDGRDLRTTFRAIESAPRFHVRRWDNDLSTFNQKGLRPGDYLRIDVEATQPIWSAMQPAIESQVQRWSAFGLHVSPPKHLPIAQIETRLKGKGAPSFREAIERYVEFANTEGLDKARLLEIAATILSEVERD
jgi:hypothetical protein